MSKDFIITVLTGIIVSIIAVILVCIDTDKGDDDDRTY